ncbi:MAG: response regulator transcription factor [Bacteroidota bacterium]
MQKSINIVLIDDHEMVLQGLSTLLGNHPGFNIVGEYTNGFTAVKEIKKLYVDIVLTDINMPEINGFETAQKLRESDPELKIIMLSMEVKQAYVQKAKQEQINAYVSKDSPIQDLIAIIKKVYLGESHFELMKALS